jgi:hypothetical protein
MRSQVLRLLSLSLALILPAGAARAAAVYHSADAGLAPLRAPLAPGAKVRVTAVPLLHGGPETLEVEKFDLFTEDAEIVVFGANGAVVRKLPLPAMHFYRGRVEGQPDSLVFLSVTGDLVEGVIYANERKFALGSRRTTRDAAPTLVVEESSVLDDNPAAGQGFTCEVEGSKTISGALRPRALSASLAEVGTQAAPTGTQRSVINLAVETDYELFTRADNNATNVSTFIANLVGAASTVYERDLLTEIRLAYLGIQSDSADPFFVVPGAGATTIDALLELGTRWHNTPPTANKRSAVALISGKSQSAGVAWVGTVCENDFSYSGGFGGRYSYMGGIDPPSTLAVPDPDANANYQAGSNSWPLLALTHELGHNVGSDHTHCISLSAAQKTQYSVTRDYIDQCYASESGCYGGATIVPTEKGTIMSYCHLRSGGSSNTRYTFGQPGEVSEIVRNMMRGYMAALTPSLSPIGAPTSIGVGASGTASVASVAGLTYSWSIGNGTITGGQNTNAIQFTATGSPVTVRVTATNNAGCSVTDRRVIAAAASVPIPTNVVATATGATSVNVTWSPASGAASYDVFRSAGGAFVEIGSTSGNSFSDNTASANDAYRYAVRSVASDGTTTSSLSDDDLATTVMFTDATLVAEVTEPRLVHFTQLLTAVNAVRSLAGLGGMSFSLPAPSTVTDISGQHLFQLRTGLAEARTAISAPALTWTDPSPIGATIKAEHITQLRNGVR